MDDIIMDEFVPMRLAKLRTKKGVSAREMSLAIGQNASYINHIESGRALPALPALQYICHYLGISVQDFFDTGVQNPPKLEAILKDLNQLDDHQLDLVAAFVKELAKK